MNHRSTAPSHSAFSIDLQAVYHLLRENYRVIAGCIIAAGILAAIHIARTPPTYSAQTTIQIERGQGRVTTGAGKPDEATTEEAFKTIEQNILSPALLLRVAQDPELQADSRFLADVRRPVSESRLQEAMARKVSARLRRGTWLIDITAEDGTPALAQKIADQIVREFVRTTAETRAQASKLTHEYLWQEAEGLKAELAKSEQALQTYKEKTKAVSLEEKQNIVVERLKELNVKVTAAKAERLKIEEDRAQILRLANDPPERLLELPTIAGAEEVIEIKRRVSEKEAEIAALSQRYKAEHPKHIQAVSSLSELKSGLDDAIRKAAARVGTVLDSAETMEKNLEAALRGQEGMALELGQMAIPYDALVREVESDRALYNSLLARLKESSVGQSASQYAVQVVTPAFLPDRPIRPNKRLIVLLALFGGLGAGLAWTLGSLCFDTSLKTVNEGERTLGLHALAAIPSASNTTLQEARGLLLKNPGSAIAETFRALRTALLFAGGERGYRTVLFTSAVPGEGKSFCAINYAVALAQQGFRTLLLDADLRLPSIGPVFLGEAHGGLSEVLLKRWELDDAVRLTDIENLSVLAAGARVARPAELMGKGGLPELLRAVVERFDRVVIDSAPVNAVSDTLLLAPRVEAVCLVVRAGKTASAASIRALQEVRGTGANVAGFVLNGVPNNHGGYYYHYRSAGYGSDEVYGATAVENR